MKKAFKAAVLAATIAGVGSIASIPVIVSAVDNSFTRPLYTKKEIDEGALDHLMNEGKVTFNSINDPTAEWYDETNFVGARLDDGDKGKDNIWNHESIVAKDGETYVVRAFVHNNTISDKNTWKQDGRGVAHGTKISFNIPQVSDTEINIHGFVSASNAVPQEIYDNVTFKSENGQKFHLRYIYGSALEENNAIEPWYDAEGNKHTGRTISDDIVKAKSGGTSIGFESPNGELPGCYYFADFVSIKVQVVYDTEDNFSLRKTVRHAGTTGHNWVDELNDVKIGDELEYQIAYRNTGTVDQMNVMVIDALPANIEYIPGTTKLWNADIDGATNREDTIMTTGVNIGNYAPGANAYIRFRAKVVDNTLACGSNTLNNWAKASVNDLVLQDFASVTLNKDCEPDQPTPTPTPEEPTTPDTPVEPETPKALPSTGPEAIAGTVVGTGAVVTAAGYYIASRRSLRQSRLDRSKS